MDDGGASHLFQNRTVQYVTLNWQQLNEPTGSERSGKYSKTTTNTTHTEPDENNQERFDEITFQPLGTRVGWYET